MRLDATGLCVCGTLCVMLYAAPAKATTYYVGGSDPGSNWWAGTWSNLQAAVNAAASGDVVKVSGNLTRNAGDPRGSIMLTTPGVMLSGGWNSAFSAKGWSTGGRLADELAGYSILNVTGSHSDSNRFRVITISNTAANVKIEGFGITGGYSIWGYDGVKNYYEEYNGGEGGGIGVFGANAVLSHLYVFGNQSRRGYDSTSGIHVTEGGGTS